MNAAEHLAAGERYIGISEAMDPDLFSPERQLNLTFALVHLLAAIAIELGVPPVTSTPGGGQ